VGSGYYVTVQLLPLDALGNLGPSATATAQNLTGSAACLEATPPPGIINFPSPDAGPEALYFRNLLLDELELAVDELPEEQREVFVAHELEGRSFKQMAAETGVNVNTLLSRKHYAVLHLRGRLQSIYDEFMKA
jgi:DNA-directed RNA polymerase specialized sigma24 family protein